MPRLPKDAEKREKKKGVLKKLATRRKLIAAGIASHKAAQQEKAKAKAKQKAAELTDVPAAGNRRRVTRARKRHNSSSSVVSCQHASEPLSSGFAYSWAKNNVSVTDLESNTQRTDADKRALHDVLMELDAAVAAPAASSVWVTRKVGVAIKGGELRHELQDQMHCFRALYNVFVALEQRDPKATLRELQRLSTDGHLEELLTRAAAAATAEIHEYAANVRWLKEAKSKLKTLLGRSNFCVSAFCFTDD